MTEAQRRLTNRGVFGGTAGLWLLQKKQRLQNEAALAANNAQQGDMKHRLSSSQSTLTSSAELFSFQKVLPWIGCDDEQSRPHNYDHSMASAKPPSSSDSEKINFDASVDPSPSTRKKSPAIKIMLTKTAKSANKRRRGIFGVRKRVTNSSPSTSYLTLFPSAQSKRICILTSNSSQAVDKIDADSFAGAVMGDITNKVFSTKMKKDNDGIELSCQESVCSSVIDFKTYQDETEPSLVRQPGFRTSVGIARAFFALLDADQTLLTLEHVNCSREPFSGMKRNISTRRGKLQPELAQSEYRKYSAVCLKSKIKPLPIKRFLEQRATFFRQGDVFDGMFDE